LLNTADAAPAEAEAPAESAETEAAATETVEASTLLHQNKLPKSTCEPAALKRPQRCQLETEKAQTAEPTPAGEPEMRNCHH
jgi:ATP-dependent RNA helicase SUPV3L1/SUV3